MQHFHEWYRARMNLTGSGFRV